MQMMSSMPPDALQSILSGAGRGCMYVCMYWCNRLYYVMPLGTAQLDGIRHSNSAVYVRLTNRGRPRGRPGRGRRRRSG